MLVAVIGIGSNSLRMLVADVKDAQIHRILRDREGLRVFAALDAQKNISPEMMEKAAESIRAFLRKAESYQVEKIHVFATSAVRDASNQKAFCEYLQSATGYRPEICSGEREARLSFLGATEGERCGMIDIGGGSTELVIGGRKGIECSASLQIGAVRLFREFSIQSSQDAHRVADHAKQLLIPTMPAIQKCSAVNWVGVGGTFTTLAALLQNISWTDKNRIHGYQASLGDLLHCIDWLAPMPQEQRNQLPGLQPQRADIVVHGMAILLGIMETFSIDRLAVSECGNLEGYLKERYC